jgi:hypothetical protein
MMGIINRSVQADLEGSCRITAASTFTCEQSGKNEWDTTFKNVQLTSGSVIKQCSTFILDRGRDRDCKHANAIIQEEQSLQCLWIEDEKKCVTQDVFDDGKSLGTGALGVGAVLTSLGFVAMLCFGNYLKYGSSTSTEPAGSSAVKYGDSSPDPPDVDPPKVNVIVDPAIRKMCAGGLSTTEKQQQAQDDAAALQRR